MSEDERATDLLESIEAEQSRLRELLSAKDETMLAERPPSGRWSVVENVRHLLFAEQLHIGRFVPGGREWSTLGLPPQGMQDQKQLRLVGSAPTSSIREVLEAWQAVHTSTRELANQDTEEVRRALQRNLRHLRAHIKVAERLLLAGR